MGDYHGLSMRTLSSNLLELDCLETAGPRIVALRYKSSANLFAELPEVSIPTLYGGYRYLGGHRLWAAPEGMPRSYIPDGDGLTVSGTSSSLVLDGRTEPGTGIHKRIEIQLDPDRARVSLEHTIVNEGLWEVELAPWAISMFRLGGLAVLPFQEEHPDPEALLPDRHISLWAYTRLNDPCLQIKDDFIILRAKPHSPPFKIGTFNPRGWIAYRLDDILFRKTFTVQPGLPHPDGGCNAEIYCNAHFIELESLAPLTRLAPGKAVSLIETWELFDGSEQGFIPDEIMGLATER